MYVKPRQGDTEGQEAVSFVWLDLWMPLCKLWSAIALVNKDFVPWGKMYEACPERKDTKVLNMHIFNLQKRHCQWIAFT